MEREEARERIAYAIKCAAYNQPLMGVDWTRPENRRWLEAADRVLDIVARPTPAPGVEALAQLMAETHGRELWEATKDSGREFIPCSWRVLCSDVDGDVWRRVAQAVLRAPATPTPAPDASAAGGQTH